MSIIFTLIAAVLFAVGWVAGTLSLLVLWCWSAVAVGWDAARAPHRPADELVEAR